MNNVTISFRPV